MLLFAHAAPWLEAAAFAPAFAALAIALLRTRRGAPTDGKD